MKIEHRLELRAAWRLEWRLELDQNQLRVSGQVIWSLEVGHWQRTCYNNNWPNFHLFDPFSVDYGNDRPL